AFSLLTSGRLFVKSLNRTKSPFLFTTGPSSGLYTSTSWRRILGKSYPVSSNPKSEGLLINTAHVETHFQNSSFLFSYSVRLPAFVESLWKKRVRACPLSITPR